MAPGPNVEVSADARDIGNHDAGSGRPVTNQEAAMHNDNRTHALYAVSIGTQDPSLRVLNVARPTHIYSRLLEARRATISAPLAWQRCVGSTSLGCLVPLR